MIEIKGVRDNVIKSALLTCASAAVLCGMPGNALAQTTPDASPGNDEEIVVTAQRRAENVQDVPIAISVMSGAELDASNSPGIADALRSVPLLDFDAGQYTGGAVNLRVRGVASGSDRAAGSGPVAYYMDGVPYGFIRNATYPDPAVYDLERVEFLSGPQGTLYGAGSLNGALRIFTHDADVDDFQLKFRGSVSMTEDGGDNSAGDLAVNVPLIPGVLGVRAVAGVRNDSGWIDSPVARDVNANDATNYRLRVRAEPTEALSISLTAWHSEDEIGAPNLSTDDRRINVNEGQPGRQEFDVYSLNIANEFRFATLSSTTSLVEYNNIGNVNGRPAGFPGYLEQDFDSRVFAQEFNLVSSGEGPWRWSTGVFYREAEESARRALVLYPSTLFATTDNFGDTSESYAVYGELTRYLTDDLSLTAGLRYFHDEQTTVLNQSYTGAGGTFPAGSQFSGESEAWTPRLVLTWEPSVDETFYASYSQGFRSGFNQQPSVLRDYPAYAPVEPDRLTNYEVGNKGRVFEGRLAYEVALFYIDWQDVQQVIGIIPPGSPIFISVGVNGESASGFGASAAANYQVTDNFDIGFSVGWNGVMADADIVSGTTILARKGDRPNSAPEWTASIDGSYGWDLGGDYGAELTLSGRYMSERVSTSNTGQFGDSDATLTLNGRFSIEAPSNWTLSLFGDNLTDEDRTPNITILAIPEWTTRIRPLTVGLQLEFAY